MGTALATVLVLLQTNLGDIKVEVYPQHAPITAKNFLTYVQGGFYDGLIFHRVVPHFVVQAGGYEPGMQSRPPSQPPIHNESDRSLKNLHGTLSMARTGDPHSATAQFFINLADNTHLDYDQERDPPWGYAVFGKVIAGMKLVEGMNEEKRHEVNGMQNVPVRDIIIRKATIVEPEAATPSNKKKN